MSIVDVQDRSLVVAEHADDVAKILDHLDLARVSVYGASGAAPHILAFAAMYPQRVRAVTIMAGAAPTSDAEAETTIPINTRGRQLARAHDVEGLRALRYSPTHSGRKHSR